MKKKFVEPETEVIENMGELSKAVEDITERIKHLSINRNVSPQTVLNALDYIQAYSAMMKSTVEDALIWKE